MPRRNTCRTLPCILARTKMFDLALFDKALEMMFRMAGVAVLANHDVELLTCELPWK